MHTHAHTLTHADPEVWQAISSENARQEAHIELIASENYASRAVMAAQGSQLTNKYAEGYPGKRYYGGCEFVDVVEQLAIDRVKKIFGAQFANVQPHSGAQANQAILFATLQPGDTILGMSLPHGGHLTHGSPVNFATLQPGDTILGMSLPHGGHLTHGSPVNMSGKWFKVVAYGLDRVTELIDYAAAERLAHEHKPKLIIAGASAYSRVIDWARFRAIADSVGAYLMVDMAHYSGLIAAGVYPNPVGTAHFVTSTTHKTLRGPRGGFILAGAEHEKQVNSAVFPGLQGGPLMHVIAAKAVAFKEAQAHEFKVYQERVLENARVLAVVLQERGLRIVSGGTDSHMFLVDLRAKKITGKDAEAALGRVHITVNKNAIPNDPEKPFVTSGIRIGSPAMTTRGFSEIECEELGHLIADLLDAPDDAKVAKHVLNGVRALTSKYPVYA